MIRWIPAAVMVLAAGIAIGCGTTIHRQVRQTVPSPPERNTTLLAGVDKADITPRPGMPTAGYATNGNYGMGFRTRLYARVIYLKPVNNRPVALVQSDLLSGSGLVHRRLAEQVAQATDLDVGGIMMSGTHTHSGPGNLYTGYCTTPEEYRVQRYEGGHTLYGPNTTPFIAAQTAKLVGDMATR